MSIHINAASPDVTLGQATRQIGNIILTGWEFGLPDGTSSVLWYEWPTHLKKPIFDIAAASEYQKVKIAGKELIQPRQTLCYGTSYTYSNIAHKLESVTPPEVQALMDFACQMYAKAHRFNVICLANSYPTLYHHINKHSDNKSQMGSIKDVICFVIGATRTLGIYGRKSYAGHEGLVLSVNLPEGIYIMSGQEFQSHFKHGIPLQMESIFKTLCPLVAANMTIDEKIIWLQNHPDTIRTITKKPVSDEDLVVLIKKHSSIVKSNISKIEMADWLAVHPKIVKKEMPKMYSEYQEWNKQRDSYTIRFFRKDV